MIARELYNLYALMVKPSHWAQVVQEADSGLSAGFRLLDVKLRQWRNARLQQILFGSFIVIPAGNCAIILMVATMNQQPLSGPLAGLLLSVLVGYCIAIVLAVAYGIVVCGAGSLITGLLWPGYFPVLTDYATGQHLTLFFSVNSALLIIVSSNLTGNHSSFFWTRLLNRNLLIVIAALLVAFSIVGSAAGILTYLDRFDISTALLWLLFSVLIIGLSLGLAIRIEQGTIDAIYTVFALALPSTGAVLIIGFGVLEISNGYLVSLTLGSLLLGYLGLLYVLSSLFGFESSNWASIIGASSGALSVVVMPEFIYGFSFPAVNIFIILFVLLIALFFPWVWSVFVYVPQILWNSTLYAIDRHRGGHKALSLHSVFHDELQRLPHFELADHLLYTHKISSGTLELILRGLESGWQRNVVQRVRVELDVNTKLKCNSLNAVSKLKFKHSFSLFASPEKLTASRLERIVSDISAGLSQVGSYNQLLVLNLVSQDLEHLRLELGREKNGSLPLCYERVADLWHNLVQRRIDTLRIESTKNHEIPNPYIVGAPLTHQQQLFVGREDIARYFDDLLSRTEYPPILLHGSRRMGKTSLLYQLRWFLPKHILVLVVDLQGPISLSRDNSGFLYALSRAIRNSAKQQGLELPQIEKHTLALDPFTQFDQWLDSLLHLVESREKQKLLLALDEFEALDESFTSGRLQVEEILGTLRHIMQHKPNIKLLIAGSHTLDDFRDWSSYLVNVQVIPLKTLHRKAAVQLIEFPVPDFPLKYETDAVEACLTMTGGHPYLLQLLCMEIVALKNSQNKKQRLLVTLDDVMQGMKQALVRGQQFFIDFELNQISTQERQLLNDIATRVPPLTQNKWGDQLIETRRDGTADVTLDTLDCLLHREVIKVNADRTIGFQIDAIRLWFSNNGGY